MCTLYPKLEIKSKYRELLEHLYIFYCLFIQIESEFPVGVALRSAIMRFHSIHGTMHEKERQDLKPELGPWLFSWQPFDWGLWLDW